jgi:hypothetical protein
MAIQGFFTGDVKIRDLNGVLKAVDGIVEVSTDTGTVTSVGLIVGSTGTDVNVANSPITSSGNITLNLPTASATNRGLLSSADWTTFNNKQAAGNYVTLDTYQTITASKTFSIGFNLASVGGTNQPTFFENTNNLHSGSVGSNIFGFNTDNNIYFGKGSDNGGIISWNNSEVRYYTLPNANGTIALVGGSGVGTVTSIATTGPITGGTITSTGTIGITQATTSTDGYLSSTDWNTFNNKQGALTLTTTGTSGAATLVGTTLNIPQYTEQFVGTVTSVAASITGNSIGITGSPITSSGTLAFAFAGNATQYVRGDGALATLPTNGGGGGASVSYYLNGSVNQGTLGGVTYYEMNKTPIIGAGTDFTRSSNGYIASFLTDANDPALLNIPAGNFNFETYFQASSGGGSPTFYIELYKYDGTTFTLIASNSGTPKLINDGTNIEAYFSALAVPQTTLTLTDRLAIRIYVTTAGRTITLHTENGHLCQVITTFTTGLTALNGLTAQVQYLATGTSGTDFNISSATATHTFNLPTASATNRGALSSADWTTFNNKQNALTNPITGTGTTNTLPKFTGASTIGNSNITDTGSLISLGSNTTISSGALGIGTTSLALASLRVAKTITGGTTIYGIWQNGTVQSDVTASAIGFLNTLNTAASAFTLSSYTHINLQQTTIGAGSSITNQYGVFIDSLTGATNNYGFFGNIPSGTNRWNLYMFGTANNYLAGSLGIGTTSLTNVNLYINKNITGATTAYGILNQGTIQSDATTQVFYYRSFASTQAAAFTLGVLNHYTATLASIGAGSSITEQNGFNVDNTIIGATNNYGFRGRIPSGTGRWNLYMDGTAANYMAGNLLLNTTTDAGFRLDVNGTARVQGNLTTNLTASSVPFIGASGLLSQDNTNFVWNNTTKALGIGLNNPTEELTVKGTIRSEAKTGADNVFFQGVNSSSVLVGEMKEASSIGLGGLMFNGQRQDNTGGAGVFFGGFAGTTSSGNASAIQFVGNGGTISSPSDLPAGIPIALFSKRTGGATSNQMALFQTGNLLIQNGGTFTDAGFRLDVNGTFRQTGSTTASSAIARGSFITPTLVAAANNDVLVGLDINPTFTNGAFTGVANIAARINGILAGVTRYESTGTGGHYMEIVSTTSTNGYVNLRRGGGPNGLTAYQLSNHSGTASAELSYNAASGETLLTTTNFLSFATGSTRGMQMFTTTRNVVIQNGGTFTDAGFRLDVNGTARVQGMLTAGSSSVSNSITLIQLISDAGTVNLRATGANTLRTNGPIVGENSIQSTDVLQGIRLLINGAARLTATTADWLRVTNWAQNDNGNVSANLGTFGTTYATINASAQLEIASTTKGFLPPRMTTTQRTAIASPATGLIVYQTDGVEGLWLRASTGWVQLTVV